jgi:hypothetical protein
MGALSGELISNCHTLADAHEPPINEERTSGLYARWLVSVLVARRKCNSEDEAAAYFSLVTLHILA